MGLWSVDIDKLFRPGNTRTIVLHPGRPRVEVVPAPERNDVSCNDIGELASVFAQSASVALVDQPADAERRLVHIGARESNPLHDVGVLGRHVTSLLFPIREPVRATIRRHNRVACDRVHRHLNLHPYRSANHTDCALLFQLYPERMRARHAPDCSAAVAGRRVP